MTEVDLTHPGIRHELVAYVQELALPDPRLVWRAETAQGLISDLDQVYHFFFDDHDFDESEIGRALLNLEEVEAIATLQSTLYALLEELPNGADDQFVEHALWPQVTRSAQRTLEIMERL